MKFMIEKTLETKSGIVHYWISEAINPEKTNLFFLHGLTASHELFEKQIEHFSKNYNVIAWDAPAHGASRPFEDFTYEKAAFAAKQILTDNGIDKAVFIGQSMGGFITQSVLKRFPELVEGFVSIDSCPFGEKYYSKSDKWWLRQIEWMSSFYSDKTIRKAIAKQCTRTDRAYRNMLNMLAIYSKKELCHLMGIGFAGILEDNCDMNIKCPVMLIVGEYDMTGKVKHYNNEWSKDIKVPVTWIKDAAHNSNDDQPEQVNEHIERFLLMLEKGERETLGPKVSNEHIEALSPEMKAILQAELDAGNEICETYKGWKWEDSICVFLKYSFKTSVKTDLLGIVYNETNDPHYWKAEYFEEKTHQMIACNFDN